MNYHYINTDTDALRYSPHAKWIEYNYAFTSGGIPEDYERRGKEVLGKLAKGDMLFMYASKIGVVAAGRVCESWDGCSYEGTARCIYKKTNFTEYRIRVDWCFAIPDNPISAEEMREIFGWQSPSWGWQEAGRRIKDEDTDKANRLLREIQRRVERRRDE